MIRNVGTLVGRMRDYAGAKRIPLSGSFELTARCNLHCAMCYICNPACARAAELSSDRWLDILRQARDAGMLFAMLTGGEPLVRDDFWDIYLGARELGLLVTLNTNATTITPEVADRLAKYPPLRVAITVYGASPEGYGRATGSAGAYEKMRRGVELLRERGIPFRLRTTLTRDTLPEIAQIIELLLSYGSQPSFTNYIMPTLVDNGNDARSCRLDPEAALRATKLIYKTIREYRAAHGDLRERERSEVEAERAADLLIPLDPEQEELHRLSVDRKRGSAFFCQAGVTHFWATYEGKMTMCGLSREPCFDLKTMRFQEAFDALGEAVRTIPECADCKSCEHRAVCSPCPAKLYLETGRYDQKAEYLCSFAKAGMEIRE